MYINGFVVPVPEGKKAEYKDIAEKFWEIAKDYGALSQIEAWEVDVKDGKLTDFRRAVQATADETVAFAWVEWPDKATRDAAMKKMQDDPRMDPANPANPPMPFDGKRMIFGGFAPVVDLRA